LRFISPALRRTMSTPRAANLACLDFVLRAKPSKRVIFQEVIFSAGQKTKSGRLWPAFEFPLLRGDRDGFRIGGSSNLPEPLTTVLNPQ
jgi:hypothetical protein